MKPSLVIFLHSNSYDRVYQAASLLLSASSMGWPCHLFLFYQALADFMGGSWESNLAERAARKAEQRGAAEAEASSDLERAFTAAALPSVSDVLDQARNGPGGLHLYACSASMRILGFDPSEVRRKVDEIVGLPTMLQIAESCRFAWYI